MRQILEVDWEEILSDGDINYQWNNFLKLYKEAELVCIPQKKVRNWVRKQGVPHDKGTLIKIKQKNRLWHNYVRTGDQTLYRKYCQARNQVRKLTRQSHQKYEKQLAMQVKTNPKKFWSYAGSKTKIRPGIPNLSMTGNEHDDAFTTDKEKAEVLSAYFSSVFTREPDGEWNLPEPVQLQSSMKLDLSVTAVVKVLSKLKVVKSPGPDGIHPRVLYELRDTLGRPLSKIFLSSLNRGEIPDDWKCVNITAIHKKDSKKIAGNYRPISLTSVVCKIMETLIRDSLMDYLKRNNILSRLQFGFVSGRSTVLQLLKVMDHWTETLDKGGNVDVVYCDFLKAFDKVPHKRLIQKLKFYGVQNPVLGWIRASLSERKQRVMVNGSLSDWKEVLSGILQGSVLGPCLFVAFINSLPDSVIGSDVFLFADDTKVFKSIFTESDCDVLQDDINNMVNWTEESLLKFHPDKCVTMRVGKSKLPASSLGGGIKTLIALTEP